MLVLLPPSETKRPGGVGEPLSLSTLVASASLEAQRRTAVDALVALSSDPATAIRVLKLGARLHGEVDVNAALWTSPTMPAVDRYTGVLFDALDAASLDRGARSWLGEHVWIHSAPFGPLGALDPIPAYRLGAGTSVPGLGALRRHWASSVGAAIADAASHGSAPYVLDMRSEMYVALGPIPAGVASDFVRVVNRAQDGTVRALNHFNKHAKGAFVRSLASSRAELHSRADLLDWARSAGHELAPMEDEIHLIV